MTSLIRFAGDPRWVRATGGALALLLFGACSGKPVFAGDFTAQIAPQSGGKPISGLTLAPPAPQVAVETHWTDGGAVTYAVIRGRFIHPGWNLISGQRKIQLSKKGDFRLLLPVAGRITRLNLTAIGLRGETEPQLFQVTFATYDAYMREQKAGSTSRFRLNPGVNLSFISYSDPRVSSYSEKALTAKLGMSYLLAPPRWSIEAGGYYTILPLSKSSSTAAYATDNARFLGVNARVGYQVQSIREPWGLSIQGGVYYTTMYVANDDFGFVNMAGPEIYPVLRRTLRNGDALVFYAKFSPVTTAVAGGLLDNRELAGGGSYLMKFHDNRSVSFTLDIASLQLIFPSATVNSNSVSLGFGYSLF